MSTKSRKQPMHWCFCIAQVRIRRSKVATALSYYLDTGGEGSNVTGKIPCGGSGMFVLCPWVIPSTPTPTPNPPFLYMCELCHWGDEPTLRARAHAEPRRASGYPSYVHSLTKTRNTRAQDPPAIS